MGYRGIGRPNTHIINLKTKTMGKTTEKLERSSVTELSNVGLEDILIFPEFIKNFGYVKTQISWEDSATPDDMLREPNSEGKVLNEEGQVVGQRDWRSPGVLALSIFEGKPMVLFLNFRAFKESEKIMGDNKDTAPFIVHEGSRAIMKKRPSRNSVYKVVATYNAVRTTRNGEKYQYSQLGIDKVAENITYTDTHMIIGEEKFLIDDIVKLYDDIFA